MPRLHHMGAVHTHPAGVVNTKPVNIRSTLCSGTYQFARLALGTRRRLHTSCMTPRAHCGARAPAPGFIDDAGRVMESRCHATHTQAIAQGEIGDAGLQGTQHVLAAACKGLCDVLRCEGSFSPAMKATCGHACRHRSTHMLANPTNGESPRQQQCTTRVIYDMHAVMMVWGCAYACRVSRSSCPTVL